ncbi:MAG: EamA family transporter RarD [Actinomycetales bacterium]|nr:EamA family transporter RarD [Actinomycetales bacterium]
MTSAWPTDPPNPNAPHPEAGRGALYGLTAYLLWGFFPLYFHALGPSGPLEVLAHRIVWSLLFCIVVLVIGRRWAWLRPLLARRKLLVGLTVAALVLAINWGVYVGAVLAGHTSEAALGYFLNPLLTVALGVVILGEPLRRLQWVAVAIGAVAAGYLTVVGGSLPWIALTLASSFALYGLIKKRVGASLPALHGLTVETAALFPVALVLLWMVSQGADLASTGGQQQAGSTFLGFGGWHTTLLLLTGPVTAIPLLLFASAARRVPLVTIGLLQFLTPVMQLLCSLILAETISAARWVGFAIVWLALAVLSVDSWRARMPSARRP